MADDLLALAYERWLDDLDIEDDKALGLLGDEPTLSYDDALRFAWMAGVKWSEAALAGPGGAPQWDRFRATVAKMWRQVDGHWVVDAPPGVAGLWVARVEEHDGLWHWNASTRYTCLNDASSPPGIRGMLPRWHVGDAESSFGTTTIGLAVAQQRAVEALIAMLERTP